MVCWVVPAWIIFELAPTKLAHYTLPTFGGLAILAAAAVVQPIGKISRITGAGLSVFAAVLICGIAVYGLTAFGSSTAQTWAAMTVVFAALAGAGGAFLLLNRAAVTAVLTDLVCGVLAHAALSGTIRQLRLLAVAPQLVKAMDRAGLSPRQGLVAGPVAITGFHEPSFVFLTGRDTQLTDAAGAAKALGEGRPVFVERADKSAFLGLVAQDGSTAREVETVRGHNYSTGDDVVLTLFAPARRASVRPPVASSVAPAAAPPAAGTPE